MYNYTFCVHPSFFSLRGTTLRKKRCLPKGFTTCNMYIFLKLTHGNVQQKFCQMLLHPRPNQKRHSTATHSIAFTKLHARRSPLQNTIVHLHTNTTTSSTIVRRIVFFVKGIFFLTCRVKFQDKKLVGWFFVHQCLETIVHTLFH